MKILIAEDDNITRISLGRKLSKWGYEVISTVDGDEAWVIVAKCGCAQTGHSGLDDARYGWH